MKPLPVNKAAAALDVTPRTLRRWMSQGCPVARRGARGRGRAALVDPQAVEAWRGNTSPDSRVVLTLASELPEVLAEAAWQSFLLVDGSDKRRIAGVVAGNWTVAASFVLDYLRQRHPDVPELQVQPEKIGKLRQIFDDFD